MHIIKIFNEEDNTIPSCVFVVNTLEQVKLLPDKGIEIDTGLKVITFNKQDKQRAEIVSYEKSHHEHRLIKSLLEAL